MTRSLLVTLAPDRILLPVSDMVKARYTVKLLYKCSAVQCSRQKEDCKELVGLFKLLNRPLLLRPNWQVHSRACPWVR